MSFTSITVTGTYKKPDGTAESGSVTFVLSAPLTDSGTHNVVEPSQIVAHLNGSGLLSQALIANDDSTSLPTGTTYKVIEQLTATPVREYNVIVPHTAAGGTVDLNSLTHS